MIADKYYFICHDKPRRNKKKLDIAFKLSVAISMSSKRFIVLSNSL